MYAHMYVCVCKKRKYNDKSVRRIFEFKLTVLSE